MKTKCQDCGHIGRVYGDSPLWACGRCALIQKVSETGWPTLLARPQARYLAAVALVDTIRPIAADAIKALRLSDDDDSDARYQAEIDSDLAVWYTAALTEKSAAKKALIEWGHTQAASIPGYAANKADLDNLFTNWFRYPRIADKLVETILRLDARS